MRRDWIAVGGLTLLGIALRLVGLDAKGFEQDEAATVLLTRLDLGGMLSELIKGEVEATPPLYFLLAQGWSRVFGDGEVGIRSLSVLVGAATVPVAYLAARELVSRRAGIVAAALVAVNPLLIWYSQEARSYALLVLLSSLALLFFARALHDPRPRWFGLWSLSSVLALATHYVAVFLFLGQAAWLLATLGRRRSVLIAIGTVVVAGAALLPLAVGQTDQLRQESYISETSLVSRVVQLPGFFLVGFEAPYPLVLCLAAIAALLVGVGLVLLVKRTTPGERKGALVALSVGMVGIVGPLVMVFGGIDFFLYKYVLGALIPLAIGVAAGLTAARGGTLGYGAAAGLVALSLGIVIGTAWEPKYQRESWREAAEALGGSEAGRAIVVTPGNKGRAPLRIYLPEAREMAAAPTRVAEVDVLALRQRGLGAIATPRLPEVADPAAFAPLGYRLVEQREDEYFLLVRYRSSRMRTLSHEQLVSSALDRRDRATPIVLVEPAGEGAQPSPVG